MSGHPLGGGRVRELVELQDRIEASPSQTQQFLIQAARLLSGRLPKPAIAALDIAERFHRGDASLTELEAARVQCWNLCNTPGGAIDSPDVAALRAAICALYPRLDEPYDVVSFFLGLSERCRGPIAEQVRLLRSALGESAA